MILQRGAFVDAFGNLEENWPRAKDYSNNVLYLYRTHVAYVLVPNTHLTTVQRSDDDMTTTNACLQS